jgi:DNA (cytosine-5)-methyltransferase 1
VEHLGDISTVDGAKVAPVDIITFGSPCTDMSVAGKRAGLPNVYFVLSGIVYYAQFPDFLL